MRTGTVLSLSLLADERVRVVSSSCRGSEVALLLSNTSGDVPLPSEWPDPSFLPVGILSAASLALLVPRLVAARGDGTVSLDRIDIRKCLLNYMRREGGAPVLVADPGT